MKRALPAATALLAVLVHAAPARAELPPGSQLDQSTWQQAQSLLPDEILAAYKAGKLKSPIGKIEAPYQLDDSFKKASEANAGKYKLDEHGSVVEAATGKMPEYVFGAPFPKIDPSDPEAAVKIIWNYEYAYWSNGSNKLTSTLVWLNGGSTEPEREVTLQSIAMVFEGNRRKADNPEQYSRLDRNILLDPADAHGTASLGWRYKDPTRRDQLWAFVPALRRVRATTPANRSDGVFGSEMTQDDGFNGFDAKPEDFTYRLLGQKDQYMSFSPEALAGKVQIARDPDGQGWGTASPPTQYTFNTPGATGYPWLPTKSTLVARPVWIIEATPKDRYYLYGKLVFAIDRETYKVSNVVKYDWKGEPVGIFNRAISYAQAPDGYRYVNLTGGGEGGAYAENTKSNRATAAKLLPSATDNVVDAKFSQGAGRKHLP